MARPGYEDSVASGDGSAPASGVLRVGGGNLGTLTASGGSTLSRVLGTLQESDNGTP